MERDGIGVDREEGVWCYRVRKIEARLMPMAGFMPMARARQAMAWRKHDRRVFPWLYIVPQLDRRVFPFLDLSEHVVGNPGDIQSNRDPIRVYSQTCVFPISSLWFLFPSGAIGRLNETRTSSLKIHNESSGTFFVTGPMRVLHPPLSVGSVFQAGDDLEFSHATQNHRL